MQWIEEEIDLDSEHPHQYSILLHGVESACVVFWNGRLVGYGKDSRLPSEFHIPNDILFDNDNEQTATLHIVVPKFSDGSYLELQDHWKFGGIHRTVELVRRSCLADIMDYHVLADHHGNLQVSVSLRESQLLVARTIRVRLFADEQLDAAGTQQTLASQEMWGATQTVQGESVVDFYDKIPHIMPWTAETPNLYTLVIEQVEKRDDDDHSNIIQGESCRVGFRTVNIDRHEQGGGIIKVNGKPITVCGINRHEHDPDHGKVVSLKRMMQDITTLKRNNFNAIRTSHYPTHASFYRLCDYYGMYVCDEANIETHGLKPMGRLAHDRGWANAFVERVTRMVQRDYNHACIVFWSLGNEAGRGRNLMLARQRLMELDNTRPVCYESGMSWSEGTGRSELTDVVCPMYPEIPKLTNLHERDDEDRPIVLCEYSHAMNNSNGNLHLYWEKFWDPRYPRLQGGFIWDMLDQGLRKSTKDGRKYYAYGGDFGPRDTNNDRQFCINGMFSPEREPHPSVDEIKYLQQPVSVEAGSSNAALGLRVAQDGTATLTNPTNGGATTTISLSNRYAFRDLSHLIWKWQLFCSISQYSIHTGSAEDENGILAFDVSSMARHVKELEGKHSNVQYFLNIVGLLKNDAPWAKAGHVLVRQQFSLNVHVDGLRGQEKNASPLLISSVEALEVKQERHHIEISNGNTSLPFLTIDKITGAITALNWSENGSYDENILGRKDLVANYTRATTDNDRGGLELILEHMLLSFAQPLLYYTNGFDLFSHHLHWKEGGLSQDQPPSVVCDRLTVQEQNNTSICIVAECSVRSSVSGETILKQRTTYRVHKDGRIKISYKIVPTRKLRGIPSMPRIGISMELDQSLCSIQYFGRGPSENYPDRKSGSAIGVYKTTPSQMGYDYIVPSENGNRCDCEWVAFESREHHGLLIMVDPHCNFSFSALLHSAEELNHADHTCDLEERTDGESPIFVNIDHQLMGLGGDNR
jgi:beta-galactosidase